MLEIITYQDASEALARLDNDNDFRLVLDWLVQERQRLDAVMAYEMGDALLRQRQGASQVLRDIEYYARNARAQARARREKPAKVNHSLSL